MNTVIIIIGRTGEQGGTQRALQRLMSSQLGGLALEMLTLRANLAHAMFASDLL